MDIYIVICNDYETAGCEAPYPRRFEPGDVLGWGLTQDDAWTRARNEARDWDLRVGQDLRAYEVAYSPRVSRFCAHFDNPVAGDFRVTDWAYNAPSTVLEAHEKWTEVARYDLVHDLWTCPRVGPAFQAHLDKLWEALPQSERIEGSWRAPLGVMERRRVRRRLREKKRAKARAQANLR